MINNETLIYELCNKYQWFTCGSVRQYEKALTMAKGGVPITELARVIWICSDDAGKDEIHKCVLAQARDARRLSGAFR